MTFNPKFFAVSAAKLLTPMLGYDIPPVDIITDVELKQALLVLISNILLFYCKVIMFVLNKKSASFDCSSK